MIQTHLAIRLLRIDAPITLFAVPADAIGVHDLPVAFQILEADEGVILGYQDVADEMIAMRGYTR